MAFTTQQGMAQVDRNAYVNVTISLRGEKIQSATEWTSDTALKIDANNINLRVAPGGVAIVELRSR